AFAAKWFCASYRFFFHNSIRAGCYDAGEILRDGVEFGLVLGGRVDVACSGPWRQVGSGSHHLLRAGACALGGVVWHGGVGGGRVLEFHTGRSGRGWGRGRRDWGDREERK